MDFAYKEYGYKRSVSRKVVPKIIQCVKTSLGRLKMNSSIPKNWKDTTCDEFIHELNKYLI